MATAPYSISTSFTTRTTSIRSEKTVGRNATTTNGDNKTGVTSFLLKHDIDTGDIIFQEEIDIDDDDDAGSIHDKLMRLGAQLAVKTVDAIERGTATFHKQDDIDPATIKKAPKIFKDDMRIIWDRPATDIVNHIRGLSPYPAAWTTLTDDKGADITAKIFKAWYCNILR